MSYVNNPTRLESFVITKEKDSNRLKPYITYASLQVVECSKELQEAKTIKHYNHVADEIKEYTIFHAIENSSFLRRKGEFYIVSFQEHVDGSLLAVFKPFYTRKQDRERKALKASSTL